MAAIIGRKVGMTQIFAEDGARIPLTVIEAGPCPVVQVKTEERDGYSAVQLGFGAAKPKHINKPEQGHLKKAGSPLMRHLHEFSTDEVGAVELAEGEMVTVESFVPGSYVKVTGTSKGKGYAGTIKRHNFKSGPKSHGSHNVRGPGSIGAAAYPARVFKGIRMAGHMGARQVTQRGLQIVDRDVQRNLLLIKGAVPGAVGSIVWVRPD
ncbi:MAG: 50S ribosomal protein L3 [Thermoleophilia bacterium]|jgi:large subunit ribosomal protein L3|nr:50S ribosomal protein L3 [Actinomycetota bacterium]